MSGLAEIALSMDYKISGSDMNESDVLNKLRKNGIEIMIGHSEENVHGADLVVYTAAVKKDNPELVEAQKLNIRTMERSEFLGELTLLSQETISICGTHGKTTTTSMISVAFINGGKDPYVQVGADLKQIDGNYRIGKYPYFIIESCEYVDSFLQFHPETAVLLNIEEDHLDYFKDIDAIKASFKKFVEKVPERGYVIYNADDPNSCEVIKDLKCNVISFGIKNTNSDWIATDITLNPTGFYSFTATNGYEEVRIDLNVVGHHNILNALATIATSRAHGIDLETIKKSLEEFTGASRRFEYRGTLNGARVFDDYAHHPTEIKATIDSAKVLPHEKIWVVFQPHTYSRTKALWDEFKNTFMDCDNVLLLDIYAAREKDDGETSSMNLADAINEVSSNCLYVSSFEECIDYLKEHVKENDIVLTIGAGTVTKISHEITNN
ncbi:MAG: UDP-N-acetylmuramate--L-alanine ligase [Clostridia bacterium]|nr:UDP-N-acetylmuramate--L-alanine ligase [Clostridia bacterium]